MRTRLLLVVWSLAVAAVWAGACGGKTIVDGDGSDGDGGAGLLSGIAGGGGAPGCDDQIDCPEGMVCLFERGACVDACDGDPCDACGVGSTCDPCGTSSCPQCDDCLAACVPTMTAMCDENDDCASDEVCLFSSHRCAPGCVDGACEDPNLFCSPCATSTCCGCDDCVSACL
jgi:hypothetical protein